MRFEDIAEAFNKGARIRRQSWEPQEYITILKNPTTNERSFHNYTQNVSPERIYRGILEADDWIVFERDVFSEPRKNDRIISKGGAVEFIVRLVTNKNVVITDTETQDLQIISREDWRNYRARFEVR